jgi:hypothetical protein
MRIFVPARLLLAAVLLFAAACGPSGPPDGPHPLWDADAAAVHNPLPDDRLLRDGRIRMREGYAEPFVPPEAYNPDAIETYIRYGEQMESLTGFGTFASFVVPFSEILDAAGPEHFALVPLDPPGAPVPVEVARHEALGWVEVAPRVPLLPETRYAGVVLEGLTAGGRAVVPSPDHWHHLQDAGAADRAAVAAALGVAGEAPILVVPFTTAPVTRDLVAAAARVSGHAPEVDLTANADNRRWPRGVHAPGEFIEHLSGGGASSIAAGLAHAGEVTVGTYASLDLRDDDRLLDAAVVFGDRAPRPVDVEFILVTPDPDVHPPPWPVTLVQHGFGGNASDVLVRAEAFNAQGIAAAGIDALDHGPRGNFLLFFDPRDLRTGRDNLRQTVLDHIQLCNALAEGPFDLDGTCFYFGQSLGGIMGGLFSAVAPDAPATVLNVPGGGLTNILGSEVIGERIGLLFAPALGLSFDDPVYLEALPFFAWMGQTFLDPADPVNYGRLIGEGRPDHVNVSRRVLLQGGLGDRLIPTGATEDLAASMGAPVLASPVSDPGGISGLWWVEPESHGLSPDDDPHDIIGLAPVRRQAAIYLGSMGTEVVSTLD